jgi:dephospho-CoA kinase
MIVVGLTGSIGMGKSTVANLFARRGAAVYDADATVRALYAGAAVPLIEAAFPGTTADGAVDRARLSERVRADRAAWTRLEAIVHPLVRAEETAFRRAAARSGAGIAVLDIPLLLETDRAASVDVVVVVSAPAAIQRARVLARPGMTATQFEAILNHQLPDADKRRRAHFVVDTGGSLATTDAEVDGIVRCLSGMTGKARPDGLRRPVPGCSIATP